MDENTTKIVRKPLGDSLSSTHSSVVVSTGANGLSNKRLGTGSGLALPQHVIAQLPPIVVNAGPHASKRFVEFFTANIRNPNTRSAYAKGVGEFLHWCGGQGLQLEEIEPMVVASYIEGHQGAPPTVKQHLAAIRMLFDYLVIGQIVSYNPAASVRGPKYVTKKGKTPVRSAQEVRQLLDSIDISHVVGLRDRAIIGVMVYTFARVGAVVGMNVGDYYSTGKRWWVRLHEKGGKYHEVPMHHNAEEYLDAYLQAANFDQDKKAPLFRSTRGQSRVLTPNRISRIDAFRMVRRRAHDAGLLEDFCNHTFRATGITVYLQNGGTLEKAQQIAAHESPRTTKLYDRTSDAISLDEVERILI